MKIIRNGVFETNSSSTHSISIATEEDFYKWKNNENIYFSKEDQLFYSREEVVNSIKKYIQKNSTNILDVVESLQKLEETCDKEEEEFQEFLSVNDYNYFSYDYYCPHRMEEFQHSFVTPSGDEMIAFGYSGYDG